MLLPETCHLFSLEYQSRLSGFQPPSRYEFVVQLSRYLLPFQNKLHPIYNRSLLLIAIDFQPLFLSILTSFLIMKYTTLKKIPSKEPLKLHLRGSINFIQIVKVVPLQILQILLLLQRLVPLHALKGSLTGQLSVLLPVIPLLPLVPQILLQIRSVD